MERLIDDFDSSWDVSVYFVMCCFKFGYLQFICNQGTVFTFKTDFKGARYYVLNIDINKPDKVILTQEKY